MRALVKTVTMDIEKGQCWRPWSEDKEINILDMENIWEGRNRRIAELKARTATPAAESGSAFSSGIRPATPLQGIDVIDDAARNMMSLSLYGAAMGTDVDVFISVLEQISDEKGLTFDRVLDQVSTIGNTYLHLAASIDNGEIVRLIAQHSPALITRKNFNGDTALHLAARAGHWCSMETLLKFCKDIVHLPSVEGENEQQFDGKHFLLRITNEKGNTALHEALMTFHGQIACRLIEEDPESAFYLNNELESPLVLAAKADDTACVSLILSFREELGKMIEQGKAGKSPIHEAIDYGNIDALVRILSEEPGFIHFTDDKGRFPLHFAAAIGRIREVGNILDKFAASAIQRDKNGLLPVHWASIRGEVRILDKLLEHCPHPRELLDHKGRNILHFAAESGKHEVLRYIMKNPTLNELINMQDKQGNTPLHLAAMNFRPRFITDLTWWHTKANARITNSEGMTAFDVAAHNTGSGNTSKVSERLTWIALLTGGVAVTHRDKVDQQTRVLPEEIFKAEYLKDSVGTLILVSTLVATVTFAAGFTMPGGYNNSDPDQGMATMMREIKFHMFIFCDTIAMYNSVIAAIVLIWAQLGNMNLLFVAFNLALPTLGMSLVMMSLAFMAGVSVVVSKLKWLECAILIMGVTFLIILLALFYLSFCPMSSSVPFLPYRFIRYLVYCPFDLALRISGVGLNAWTMAWDDKQS